jgi:hypothetical protein
MSSTQTVTEGMYLSSTYTDGTCGHEGLFEERLGAIDVSDGQLQHRWSAVTLASLDIKSIPSSHFDLDDACTRLVKLSSTRTACPPSRSTSLNLSTPDARIPSPTTGLPTSTCLPLDVAARASCLAKSCFVLDLPSPHPTTCLRPPTMAFYTHSPGSRRPSCRRQNPGS